MGGTGRRRRIWIAVAAQSALGWREAHEIRHATAFAFTCLARNSILSRRRQTPRASSPAVPAWPHRQVSTPWDDTYNKHALHYRHTRPYTYTHNRNPDARGAYTITNSPPY